MKKILALILAFAMMLCLVACKGNDNPPDNGEGGNKTEEPAKSGCAGALSIGAVASMMLAGAWVSIAARKKND